MNEFLIAIHRDMKSKDPSPSPEQMQAAIKPFQEWIGNLIAQGKLANPYKRWDGEGRIVKHESVTNGPYAEIKESLGGLFVARAKDYEEAVEIARGCPILQFGATVEVRMALTV
jgi:hypothetical protein